MLQLERKTLWASVWEVSRSTFEKDPSRLQNLCYTREKGPSRVPANRERRGFGLGKKMSNTSHLRTRSVSAKTLCFGLKDAITES